MKRFEEERRMVGGRLVVRRRGDPWIHYWGRDDLAVFARESELFADRLLWLEEQLDAEGVKA